MRRYENIVETFAALSCLLSGGSFAVQVIIKHRLDPTLLVTDPGAVYVQGWTVLVMVIAGLIYLVYEQIAKWRRKRYLLDLAARKAAAGHD